MTFIAGEITATGLVVAPLSGTSDAGLLGILDYLTQQMNTIYGASADFTSNSPDGQALNIFAQIVSDVLQLIVMVNAGFDPIQAFGVILYQRGSLVGVQIQSATYSTLQEQITVTGPCTLYGLDQTANPLYTIQDELGNQWNLVSTVSIAAAGTALYGFQAASPGMVNAAPSTVNSPVTVVLQVTAITNPSAAIPGAPQETDAAFKLRILKSTAIGSIGYLPGLIAALQNIAGIAYANAYENDTSSTIAIGPQTGQGPHSVWTVVSPGTATHAQIANVIYVKHNAGAGIYVATGSYHVVETYVITEPDGSPFVAQWNEVVEIPLYVKVLATSLDGVNAPYIAALVGNGLLPTNPNYLPGLGGTLIPNVGVGANINEVVNAMNLLDSNSLITFPMLVSGGSGVSLTVSPYAATVTPTTVDQQLEISNLSVIVLTAISQVFDSVNFPGIGTVVQQLAVTGYNPLAATAVNAAIIVPHSTSFDFQVFGGYFAGGAAATLVQNESGGSVLAPVGMNPAVVAYTAGATPGYDVLRIGDTLGNIVSVAIQVT